MNKNKLTLIIGLFLNSFIYSQTCTNSVATYTPIATEYMNSDYNSENVAQVFTASSSASNFDVTLELATCKSNGLCDAQLDLVTVNGGEPEWTNVIGSAVVPKNQIYDWPSCQAGTFGSSTFSFNEATLNTGVQYALVLKPAPGGDPGSRLAWRRSSTPTDPSNPYSGGDLWTYNLNNNSSMQNTNLDLQFNICNTSTLGVFDHNINNNLFIYPNPSNDFIIISGLKKSNQYIIYNTLGVKTDSGNISDNEKINIQNFSNGMYFIILENGNIQKFVKK